MRRFGVVILSMLPAWACAAQAEGPPPRDAAPSQASPADQPADQPADEPADPPARRYGLFSGTYERAPRPLWFAEVEANVWYASPGGEISVGGTPLVSSDRFNLDSPRATPMVEVHLRYDPWTFDFRGSLLDVDSRARLAEPATQGAVTFAAGEAVNSSYRLDEAVFRAGYRVYQFDADANATGRPLLSAGVDLLGGVRLYDGTVGFRGPSGAVGSSFTQIEPLIGFAADVSFEDRYEIQFQNTHAGSPEIDGQSSFTVDIQVTFKYRPVDNAALQVGYRIRRNILEGDDYELDGAVAGVFAGLTVRF